MKIVVNTPAPLPPPQTTYDLCGLTENQMKVLYHAVGDLVSRDFEKKYNLPRGSIQPLFNQISDAVDENGKAR
jgi:hypothetical protein